ncbi:Muscarinic Acetylcholine Receptor M4 [Manis pentadactyla]|nr:Muscarinic Acetylcholine Receptor M4 [Manis pentadactyla]
MGMIRVCGKSTDAAVCVGKKAGIGVLKRKGAVERLKHVVTAMLYSKEAKIVLDFLSEKSSQNNSKAVATSPGLPAAVLQPSAEHTPVQ